LKVRRIRRAAAVLAIAGTAASLPVPRLTEGPPAGYSGGFGEPTCSACHIGSEENAFGGRVALLGLPERYDPQTEYLLTVLLEADETANAGFQLTARFTDGPNRGRNAGTLAPVDQRATLSDSADVSYLHQSRVGAITPSSSGSSWAVAWIAPASGESVTINVAANSGNADNSPLGDLVYTHEATVPSR
jgi:hypothetical protein